MYSFKNDYSEGCHPAILEKLAETNLAQEEGYGDDIYCNKARELIQKDIHNADADVYFISGGTQANLTVISAVLRPHESVIAVESGHIVDHEGGAIEATGHKVHMVKGENGKVTVSDIEEVVEMHQNEQYVSPKIVFISNATEIGSVYTKKELTDISECCNKNNLYLYLDGARIASAITANTSDLTLADIAGLVDIFYIGGTKNGALIGEAIVIINEMLKPDFKTIIKQRGGLLAKGRLLGIQFLTLFSDNLFYNLGKYSNQMAGILAEGITDLGFKFYAKPESNQLFPILSNDIIKKLEKEYGFYTLYTIDDTHSAIRLVTSWNTQAEYVTQFLEDLKKYTH